MPNLDLYFLGSPQIVLDGVSINIHYSKTLAMLIYLAVNGEAQRRDTLATLLWPESPQTIARASLRRELSQLKKILNNSFLIINRETIAIDPQIWLDVAHFRHHLQTKQQNENVSLGNLEQAIHLYRDDFLSGFTLPDCPEFSDWQLFETENLRHLFTNALQQLTAELSNQKQYEKAIPYARQHPGCFLI